MGRIYDEVDGSLELQLTYRPEVTQIPPTETPIATAFRLDTIADIDGDGQDEVLGSYEANLTGTEYQRVPVLIARESGEGYLVTPLLPRRRWSDRSPRGSPNLASDRLGGRARLRYGPATLLSTPGTSSRRSATRW